MAEQFPGLYTDADSADIPDGASIRQDNVQSFIPGRLAVRKGVGRQSELMDSTGTFGTQDLIAIYKYPHANGDFVITADKSGEIKTRRRSVVGHLAEATPLSVARVVRRLRIFSRTSACAVCTASRIC